MLKLPGTLRVLLLGAGLALAPACSSPGVPVDVRQDVVADLLRDVVQDPARDILDAATDLTGDAPADVLADASDGIPDTFNPRCSPEALDGGECQGSSERVCATGCSGYCGPNIDAGPDVDCPGPSKTCLDPGCGFLA